MSQTNQMKGTFGFYGGFHPLKTTFWRSAIQGIGAIADQGLFAISNFAVNLILARRMAELDYGAFSAAFATFLLLATFYTGIITEPMLVYGFSSMAQRQRSYIQRLNKLHWKLSGLVSLALTVIALAAYTIHPEASLAMAYVGWAAVAPLVLWLWFARRTAYLPLTPYRAAIAGCGYFLCMTVLLLAFANEAGRYPAVACFIFGIPSGLLALLLRMTVPLKDSEPASAKVVPDVSKIHWNYGKWASLGGLCAVLPGQIYFFILSLDRCAEYRAVMNVPMPVLQTYFALGPVFISRFTRLRGSSRLRPVVTRTLAAVVCLAMILGVTAASFGKVLLHILYSNKYSTSAAVLWPLMIYSCLYSGTIVLDSAMRSLEMVRTASLASATGAVLALLVGAPAAVMFGVSGAAYGLIGSQLGSLSILLTAWLKAARQPNANCLQAPAEKLRIETPLGSGVTSCGMPPCVETIKLGNTEYIDV